MIYQYSPHQLRAAAALLAVATFLPTTAQASSSDNVSKTREHNQQVVFNQYSECTMENVSGVAQVTFSEQSSPKKFKTMFHEHGKGTGQVSSAQYEYQEMSQHEVVTTARTFTDRFDLRRHLIRNGSTGSPPIANGSDDLFLREYLKMTVTNGRGDTSIERTQMECK